MNAFQNPYMSLNGITPEELAFLQQATSTLDENGHKQFFMLYAGKRKSPQDILLFTLLGFLVVAGVQRFVLGQIGMGLLYLFTGGFCLIGTIVDLVNHKSLALEYNKNMAYETFQMVKMNG